MDGLAPPPSEQEELQGLLEFLYLCPHGLAEFDAEGAVTMMNPACLQLLMPLAGPAGVTNLFDALSPFAPDLRHRIASDPAPRGLLLDGLRIHVGQAPRRPPRLPDATAAAEPDPLVLALTVMRLGPSRLMAVMSDVSRQVAQERRLREAEAWFTAVVNGAQGYAFFSLDAEGRVTDWNASGERLFGMPEAEALGREAEPILAAVPDATLPLPGRLQLARREGWHLSEGWVSRGDGDRFWGTSVVSVMRTGEEDPEAFLVVMRDTTERRASAEMLRRALCTDQLTTVLNRRHFFELAQEAFRNAEVTGQPVSAIMVDADHFKAVNDTHGHAAGDAVLVGLAKVLRAGVRANQDLVARLGGEEFSILLPGLGAAEAVEVAERLRHALRLAVFEAVDKEGEPVRLKVTASFGVSERTPDTADPEALLHRADAALYVAKAAGRNRVETR